MKFYFTYCSEGQDYKGGWTEVEADSMETACAIFEAYHPPKDGSGAMACGGVYSEEGFKKTFMPKCGNFGQYCHERLFVKRIAFHKMRRETQNAGDE